MVICQIHLFKKSPPKIHIFSNLCVTLNKDIWLFSSPMYHHYQQGMLTAWIPLTIFYHLSHFPITLGKSSRRHPMSTQSRWMYVLLVRQDWCYIYLTSHQVSVCVGTCNNQDSCWSHKKKYLISSVFFILR